MIILTVLIILLIIFILILFKKYIDVHEELTNLWEELIEYENITNDIINKQKVEEDNKKVNLFEECREDNGN